MAEQWLSFDPLEQRATAIDAPTDLEPVPLAGVVRFGGPLDSGAVPVVVKDEPDSEPLIAPRSSASVKEEAADTGGASSVDMSDPAVRAQHYQQVLHTFHRYEEASARVRKHVDNLTHFL